MFGLLVDWMCTYIPPQFNLNCVKESDCWDQKDFVLLTIRQHQSQTWMEQIGQTLKFPQHGS